MSRENLEAKTLDRIANRLIQADVLLDEAKYLMAHSSKVSRKELKRFSKIKAELFKTWVDIYSKKIEEEKSNVG